MLRRKLHTLLPLLRFNGDVQQWALVFFFLSVHTIRSRKHLVFQIHVYRFSAALAFRRKGFEFADLLPALALVYLSTFHLEFSRFGFALEVRGVVSEGTAQKLHKNL